MTHGERRVPADSFRIRLAIVRTEMGWNYEEAQAATGVGAESWRLWEKGLRHCTDVPGVSRKIAAVTSYDVNWLAMGGPLSTEATVPSPRPQRTRRRVAANAARAATVNQQVKPGFTARYHGATRRRVSMRQSHSVYVQAPLIAQVA